jgi:hypothetical protein
MKIDEMNTISDDLRGDMVKHWKKADDSQREQLVAKHVFGLPVDDRYGKLVEKKESGGIRIIALPESCKNENFKSTQKEMEGAGWTVEIISLPRSTRKIIRMSHEKSGITVETHPMPEADGIRFCSLMAIEAQKEAAINGQ